MSRDCPDESLVLRYLGGEAREHAAALEVHVDRCASCRAWLAGLARTSLGVDAVPPSTDGDPLALGEFLPAGTDVGRYRIVAMRGRGGMGIVYEAEDPQLRRPIALKVLRASIASVGTARLLAEARTMARLSHPHVCPVFDVGVIGGRWFLAMALVEGGTLAQWLTHARRTDEIVAMFVQAGRGLVAAHGIGVIHRDFKPTNVLVDAAGRAVVCDFGLAVSEHDPTLPTGGTPRYMPPEQVGGGGDARVDQFAFGVALRDALDGHTIAPRLLAAIARATAPDPNARFVDMTALLAAIESGGPRRRWAPIVALGTVAVALPLAFALPGVERSTAYEQSDAHADISAPVQALLDESIEYDRNSDPRGSVVVLDGAVELAEAAGDRPGLALCWAARGSQLGKVARFVDAIDDLERSFNLAMEIERDDIAADAAIIRVGLLAQQLGRADEALTWGRHVEATLGRDDSLDIRVRADFDKVMGGVHFHRNELDLARARFQAAIDLLRTDQPRLERHLASALTLMGTVELRRNDLPAAHAAMTESIALAESVHGPDHPEVGGAVGSLAGVAAAMGDLDEAHALLERARRIIVAAHGEHHPNVLAVHASVASLWMRAGKYELAREGLERVLADAPTQPPITCGLHERLGVSLGKLGRKAQGVARLEHAIDCYDDFFGQGSRDADRAGAALAELRDEK